MGKYLKFIFIPIILILLIICVYFYQDYAIKNHKLTTFSMGSCVEQEVFSEDQKLAQDISQEVAQKINNLDELISWRNKSSDIYRINHQKKSGIIKVNPETCKLLSLCLDVSQNSNGAFDPTIFPLCELWGSCVKKNTIPSDIDILRVKSLVDYRNFSIDLQNSTINISKPSISLDLGAIGKGFACDIACETYGNSNISAALISVGGTIGTFGHSQGGNNWEIAIKDPFDTNKDSPSSMGVISLKGGYVSTSGSYEKNFYYKGKMYHHVLDPKTGYPVESDMVSVSVISDSGALSDALSTACFVLGPYNSNELLKKYKAKAIFIDKNKNVILRGDNIQDIFRITSTDFKLETAE